MFKRFLFLAILIIAASPRDAIAEEPGDVFGFRWKMSYAEASKIASGRMEKNEKLSHYGKTVYNIDNPRAPSDATDIGLSFFNDELYSVSVNFFIKSEYYFTKKTSGLVKFLESKHPDAKLSEHKGSPLSYWVFTYRNEAGFIENPYNLERIKILGVTDGLSGFYLLTISYNFYGTEKIETHITKLENEKEFGDF